MSTAVRVRPETLGPDGADVVRRARRVPRRRRTLVLSGLALLLFAVFWARVLLGDFTITVPDFFRILSGTEIPGASFILMESKLPRAVLGVLVGGCFGVAGAMFQATLRNPLASPDVIGVSLGASAAAVTAIVLLGLEGAPVSGAAILGALGAAVLVRVVAGPGGTHHLVLAGIGMAAALLSVVHYLFTRADVWDAQLVLRWLTGSVGAADWPTIRLLALALLVLLPLILWVTRTLPLLELGEDTATGLGAGRWSVDAVLLVAVVLTAVGVAAAGPISFVAFLAGPIARILLRGRTTLLGAALVGATIVVGADYVADYLLSDINFPTGVVTGAFGAPFLLWLLASGRTGRRVA
ncbi:FecCD family ABC transporter permease [Nocardioides campestrisoli]|uniref:FecCD family ABC transporter permease n=1 Tax=Nocardioides campestrisoli TaxID=2736757 RepID=UPI001CD4E5DF|nr:iron ABC transporter permease [Nocardioides campestrisoli]